MSEFIGLLIVGLLGLIVGLDYGIGFGRIDVASGKYECRLIHDSYKESSWKCKRTEEWKP